MKFPKSIQNLINELSKLPTVGPKTAERFAFYLLRQAPGELTKLAEAIQELKQKVTVCRKCFSVAETDPCQTCSDPKRSSSLLCLVADTRDLIAIESTGQYNGYYHVLGGELDPIAGIKPDQLTITQLLNRVKNNGIKEVILALNPTMEGETTSLYLVRLLRDHFGNKLKLTRIARGLPMGADLEYADEITLSNALKFRNEL